MRPGPEILVAVPARDESGRIAGCLDSVVLAVRHARDHGVGHVRVAVAAHRCEDSTAERAARLLDAAGVDHLVLADEDSTTVGQVRTRLVDAAMRLDPPLHPERTWLLSTDADTVVPRDWVTGLLDVAARTGADLVAGFVTLDGWQADLGARAAYDRLIRAGLTDHGHEHVWAANLAVSYAAFRRAGGFPSVAHGEERALADRVARTGRVVGALHPSVTTSARMPGRAPHGLGDLLRRLAEDLPDAV